MDIKNKKWVLYIHILKQNPEQVYIGITSQQPPSKRWDCGRGYKHCPKMWQAIQKFGWDNFEHKILQFNLTQQEAEKLEKEYILKYDSINKGFNTSPGGRLLPQQSIQKMSNSLKEYYKKNKHPWTNRHHTEQTKQKIRQSQLGTHLSEKTKEKLSQAHKGKKQSEDWIKKRTSSQKKKVLCIESNKIYESAKDCCIAEFGEFIKGTTNDIRAVCRGERPTCKGKHFQYVKEGK